MTTEHSTHLVRSVHLLEDDYRNTSSHVPLSAQCTLAEQFCTVSAPKPRQTTTAAVRVPQWDLADPTTLQHHVMKYMNSALPPDVSPTAHPTQSSDVILYASVLQQAVRYATHKSVPMRTLKPAKFKHTLPRGAVEKLKQGRILRRNLKRKFQNAPTEESRISPEFLLVKQNRKEVRAELRRAERTRRNKLYTRICRAPTDKAFHKLVQAQRKNTSRKCNLITDSAGLKHDEKEGQLMALTQHYSELALPSSSPCFDQDFLDICTINECIRSKGYIAPCNSNITLNHVIQGRRKLNRNKTADTAGLKAENLNIAPVLTDTLLHNLFLGINSTGHMPEDLCIGAITSIPKKDKDYSLPSNHRGITVTSTIEKVYENASLIATEQTCPTPLFDMQFGFSTARSPEMASVIVSEAIANAVHHKEQLYIVFLDASKAFDVVNHVVLADTLNHLVKDPQLAQAVNTAYSDISSYVKWEDIRGTSFPVKQGVRQGGTLSAPLYKLYIHPLLEKLEDSKLGLSLGGAHIGTPTCADDMVLMANNEWDLQAMIDITELFASQRRHTLHPTKSCVLHINQSGDDSLSQFHLCGEQMNTVDEVTHLGITRRSDRRLTHLVEERVKRGRRTAYALFGAGLHGSNGIGTERSLLIYHSYVYPVFMYGLESMVLDKRSIDTLATFHMSIIKELQGLPTRCANAAAYLMANQLPLPALLHIAILTLLCNIAISKNNSLEILLKRHCALRVRKSWAMNAQDTLDIYDMGSIDDIFKSDNPRLMKKHFKQAIRKEWNRRLKGECAGKSSLRWLHLPPDEQLHIIWRDTNCPSHTRKATIKARMTTGCYILQADVKRFNQNEVNATCLLCDIGEPENIDHFLCRCSYPPIKDSRERFLPRLIQLLHTALGFERLDEQSEYNEIVHLVLDCTAYDPDESHTHDTAWLALESHAREYCYELHRLRYAAVKELRGSQPCRSRPLLRTA